MDPFDLDPLESVSDRSIRRALAFAGLGVGVVMLALSYDLPLALRSGASLSALAAVTMLLAAWRAPHGDIAHSEAWVALNDMLPELVRSRPKREMQQRLGRTMRRRLVWHAERVSLLAMLLWALALMTMGLGALVG